MCTNFDFTDNEFEAMLRSVKAWNAPAATPREARVAASKFASIVMILIAFIVTLALLDLLLITSIVVI